MDYTSILVVGNEAGDLDSVVSALATAWLVKRVLPSASVIPVANIPASHLSYRLEIAEVLGTHAFREALSKLRFRDSEEVSQFSERGKSGGIILVDHNEAPGWAAGFRVAGILDHHHRNGGHACTGGSAVGDSDAVWVNGRPLVDIREPRLPGGGGATVVGSCCSIVVAWVREYLAAAPGAQPALPPELALLLQLTILVDTRDFDAALEGTRWGDLDREAHTFLGGLLEGTRTADLPSARDVLKSLHRVTADPKAVASALGAVGLLLCDRKVIDWRGVKILCSTLPVPADYFLKEVVVAGETIRQQQRAEGGDLTVLLSAKCLARPGCRAVAFVFGSQPSEDRAGLLRSIVDGFLSADEMQTFGFREVSNFPAPPGAGDLRFFEQTNSALGRKQFTPKLLEAIDAQSAGGVA